MKKVFALSVVLLLFFIMAVSCNQKSSAPTSPAPGGRIQAMDATTTLEPTSTPTVACVVPNPLGAFPVIFSFPSSASCAGTSGSVSFDINSLDSPYDYELVNGAVTEVGQFSTSDAISAGDVIYFANFSLPPGYWNGSSHVNPTVIGSVRTFRGTDLTNVTLCINGNYVFTIPVGKGAAGSYSNPVSFGLPQGYLQPGNNTVVFDVPQTPPNTGVVCIWELGGCLLPAPSATPSTATPTNTAIFTKTPTATLTFTPSPTPTCVGASCVDAAPEQRQCDQLWRDNLLAGGDTDNDTICSAGCLLTSIAMFERSTPPILNQKFTDATDYTESGGLLVDKAAASLGLEVQEVPATSLSDDLLISGLCIHSHVVAQVSHPTTHYILITGRIFDPVSGTCRITVNDPSNASIRFLDDSSYDSVNMYLIFSTPINN